MTEFAKKDIPIREDIMKLVAGDNEKSAVVTEEEEP
jgi:hypothetical protein